MSGPAHPSEYPGDNSFSPVDPYAPVNYPEYPPPYPPQPPSYPPQPPPPPGYGSPSFPPPYPSPPGYPPATGYPGAYNPYQPGYPSPSSGTNGMAIASLITSIAGLLLGIPLTLFCWIGFVIPIVGTILGIVAVNQIKQTNQPGRGMAIAGIVIGGIAIALILVAVAIFVVFVINTH